MGGSGQRLGVREWTGADVGIVDWEASGREEVVEGWSERVAWPSRRVSLFCKRMRAARRERRRVSARRRSWAAEEARERGVKAFVMAVRPEEPVEEKESGATGRAALAFSFFWAWTRRAESSGRVGDCGDGGESCPCLVVACRAVGRRRSRSISCDGTATTKIINIQVHCASVGCPGCRRYTWLG